MNTDAIVESGMAFGPYPEGHCFHIEKSKTYAGIQSNVKMAEFLWLRISNRKPPTLWVVEAKSSTPQHKTQPNFDEFIVEIREKLVNAFSLCWASCLERHPPAKAELPESFNNLNLRQCGVRFVLVINGHPESWLPPLQEALEKELHSTVKTWSLGPNSVVVLNEKGARHCGLIVSETAGSESTA